MNLTLNEEQTKELIKKYYEEVEGIDVEVQFSKYQDYQFTSIQPVISKDIVIADIKVTATEEVSDMKMTEIFNFYLPAEYNFKKSSFSVHREYVRMDDYIERVTTSIELEPVDQKTRGRNI